jgi:DMSO reductase anchor subunit
MTKCNLCYDYLDEGLPPACVAACPLRCLDLVDTDDPAVAQLGQSLWKIPGEEHPFPLPASSRTEPHLVIRSHPSLKLVGAGSKVTNREETCPSQPRVKANAEIPLIIFTLFAQMAIGSFASIFLIFLSTYQKQATAQMMINPLLAIISSIVIALISSLFHLKSPKNAWRAVFHLRKSWLSREILFTLGFAGLLVPPLVLVISPEGSSTVEIIMATLTLVCGLAALFCMQRVYQLRSMPAWNSVRTLFEFSLSSIILGCWLTGTFLPLRASPGIPFSIAILGILAFSVSLLFSLINSTRENKRLKNWRIGLLIAGLLAGLGLLLWPSVSWVMGSILVLFIAFAEESIGRWLFYLRRNPGI